MRTARPNLPAGGAGSIADALAQPLLPPPSPGQQPADAVGTDASASSSSSRIDPSPLAPTAAAVGSAAAPAATGLGTKVSRYLRHIGQENYLRAHAAMLAGSLGSGATNGGFLLLLDSIQRRGGPSALAVWVGLSVAEAVVAGGTEIWAVHRLEAGHSARQMGRGTARKLCWGLVACGAIEALQSVCLVGATLGLGRQRLPTTLVLGCGLAARLVQATCDSLVPLFWQQLQPYLAPHDAAAAENDLAPQHPVLGPTGRVLERTWHSLSTNVSMMGGFLAASSLGPHQQLLLRATLRLIGLGAAASALSKLYFLVEMQRHRPALPAGPDPPS